MKLIRRFFCILTATLALGGCIQEEALNSEAAIDQCTGPEVQLANIDAINKTVSIYISRSTDLSQLQLSFTLPDGATIAADTQESGDNPPAYDFSTNNNRSFTVTSEDQQWKTTYVLSTIMSELPTVYHFDDLKDATSTPYHTFMEFQSRTSTSDYRVMEWSSGNQGYNLTGMASTALDYPTVQASNGVSRYCAKLETKSTGSLGAMVGMYIAAGNLFIGSFNIESLADAARNTKLGYPFYQIPKELKGYYKYKRGENFQEGNKIISDRMDYCDIYGILYETDDKVQLLDGTNSLTSDHLVLMARTNPENYAETDEWTPFSLTFEPVNGKSVDLTKLKEGKYKLSIVFSSSVEGGIFNGAIGSTLYIDEVELICESDS